MVLLLRRLAILGCIALLSAPVAGAGVYKCTLADGRVVFTDHACATGQTGGAMKGLKADAPAGASKSTPMAVESGGPKTAVENVRQQLARERVHQSLTPECQTLGDRASRVLQSNSNASMDEVKRAVSEFEGKCANQLVAATRKENAGGNSSSAKLDAPACQKLRQSLDADRARLSRMTDKERLAFATQQNAVANACQ